MAAVIVCIEDPEQWKIIQKFLSDCEEGAIVFSPEMVRVFRETHGVSPEDCEDGYVEYDFGGQADVWLDVPTCLNDMSVDAVCKAMELPDSESDEPTWEDKREAERDATANG